MLRRSFMLMLASVMALPASAASANEEAVWSALKSGGHIVFIRHAVTNPGIGDPPNFTIGDCSTQRNLSDKGRAESQRIGDAFRHHKIPVSDVLSSRWCRCIDTARLAFGRVKPAPMLDSMFSEPQHERQQKSREVFARAANRNSNANLIMVTHAQNILALTGVSPSSGEMIVVKLDGTDKFSVVGRLDISDD